MLWLQLGVLAGCISLGLLWLIGRLTPPPPAPASLVRLPSGVATFLFADELMFDHEAGVLPDGASDAMPWGQFRDWLAPRFGGLPTSQAELPGAASLELSPVRSDDTARLTLTPSAHGLRVDLVDPPHSCPAERHEMLITKWRMDDIIDAFERAPQPMWKTAVSGEIIWRNAACSAAFDPAVHGEALGATGQGDGAACRLPVTPDGAARPRWYEVSRAQHDWGTLHHATDITKVVTAERMQQDFVQTLTKTFAYLTIGLAVFDRNRKLALFNPALVDLTSLGAEFLSAQPDLMAFFDKLRDRRVMPEPRSYASWRTQISEVIGAAEGGLYQETWSLPNDVTYRVTGRPHPDGAVAFLFEDISAEVMVERRFRAQLDLRQSALDTLPEAVMVIGPGNVVTLCNAAAIDLIGVDPDTSFADMSVSDLIHSCTRALPAPAIWSEIETKLSSRNPRASKRTAALAGRGSSLTYRIEPLPGGARMLALQTCVDLPARIAAG